MRIQCWVRVLLAHRAVQRLRRIAAAVRLQSYARGEAARAKVRRWRKEQRAAALRRESAAFARRLAEMEETKLHRRHSAPMPVLHDQVSELRQWLASERRDTEAEERRRLSVAAALDRSAVWDRVAAEQPGSSSSSSSTAVAAASVSKLDQLRLARRQGKAAANAAAVVFPGQQPCGQQRGANVRVLEQPRDQALALEQTPIEPFAESSLSDLVAAQRRELQVLRKRQLQCPMRWRSSGSCEILANVQSAAIPVISTRRRCALCCTAFAKYAALRIAGFSMAGCQLYLATLPISTYRR